MINLIWGLTGLVNKLNLEVAQNGEKTGTKPCFSI